MTIFVVLYNKVYYEEGITDYIRFACNHVLICR